MGSQASENIDQIVLTIEGEGISPETIDVGDLAYVLGNFQRAVEAIAEHDAPLGGPVKVSLSAVTDGSGRYTLSTSPSTRAHAATAIAAIETRDSSRLPYKARKCLQAIHGRGKKYEWGFKLEERTAAGVISATAFSSDEDQLFDRPRLYGATSIIANIIKAGGESTSRTAILRLPDGTTLQAGVSSQALTEQLGGMLYRTVELHGTAVWSSEDQKITRFTIKEVGGYRLEQSDPHAALGELSEAADGFFDELDVDDYVRRLRLGETG